MVLPMLPVLLSTVKEQYGPCSSEERVRILNIDNLIIFSITVIKTYNFIKLIPRNLNAINQKIIS